jgi:excisionase family DNA binding protein
MERLIITDEAHLQKILREIVRQEIRAEISVIKDILLTPSNARGLEDEQYMGRVEIANFLKITLPTLTEWVKRGLPKHQRRRRVLFLKSEVLQWMKGNRNE